MTAEREHVLWRQRRWLWLQQHGRCEHCGRWYACSDDMALAHRLADSKANRRKYGPEVIDHVYNKALTCRELHAGVDCNAAMLVDGNPVEAEALVASIRRAMERNDRTKEIKT